MIVSAAVAILHGSSSGPLVHVTALPVLGAVGGVAVAKVGGPLPIVGSPALHVVGPVVGVVAVVVLTVVVAEVAPIPVTIVVVVVAPVLERRKV